MEDATKRRILVIAVALAIGLGAMAKLFVIGEPAAGEQVSCTVAETGAQIELRVDAVESAMALRGWRCRQEGDTLYISARKVPVSPLFHEGHYETAVDGKTVEKIVLGDKTVWSRGA